MVVAAAIGVRLGSLDVDIDLTLKSGEVVAVLGPNGAGKTTLLRCLAGLLPIDRGAITIDETPVDDPDRGVFVAPEHRPVGVVFQDYLLFANLSALENVAFGLRARGMNKIEARRRAAAWLERVGLAEHAAQRPRALSGGQAQRVALARALAPNPRLLLLDEPLAALDAGARSAVRRYLRRHLDTFEGMRLLVTHDPVDAYALSDRVVVLEAGRVVQTGTLSDVTAHPRSRYVADLVGINLLAGVAHHATLNTPNGATVVCSPDTVDGDTLAAIRPQAVAIHRRPPEGSPRNVWRATITDIDQRADRVRVQLSGPVPLVAEITPAALAALELRPGDEIWASVKATEITTHPA